MKNDDKIRYQGCSLQAYMDKLNLHGHIHRFYSHDDFSR